MTDRTGIHTTARGDSLQQRSGRPWYPLDPRPTDLCLDSMVAALARVARFGGHTTTRPYCPTMEQKVLTADLRWIPAGDLKVGTELLGFDEYPTTLTGVKRRRRTRHCVVLGVEPNKRNIVRLVFSDGSSVRCSMEHPWLTAKKGPGNQTWVTARKLAEDVAVGRKRYLNRFLSVWDSSTSYEAGWLAGIFDGEGSLSASNRTGVYLNIAQNKGAVLDRIVSSMADRGFTGSLIGKGDRTCENFQMRGGWGAVLRFLGSIRPCRLLNKFQTRLQSGEFTKEMEGDGDPLQIVDYFYEGQEWVPGLETSTHTYICEGFGAHNSVLEHLVRACDLSLWLAGFSAYASQPLADLGSGTMPIHDIVTGALRTRHGVAIDYRNPAVQTAVRQALLALCHDGAEAYVADVTRPLKANLPDYQAVDKRNDAAVYEALCGRRPLPVTHRSPETWPGTALSERCAVQPPLASPRLGLAAAHILEDMRHGSGDDGARCTCGLHALWRERASDDAHTKRVDNMMLAAERDQLMTSEADGGLAWGGLPEYPRTDCTDLTLPPWYGDQPSRADQLATARADMAAWAARAATEHHRAAARPFGNAPPAELVREHAQAELAYYSAVEEARATRLRLAWQRRYDLLRAAYDPPLPALPTQP